MYDMELKLYITYVHPFFFLRQYIFCHATTERKLIIF